MNKKLITLFAGLLSAVLLFISILPVAADYPRYPSLNLSPIQVEPSNSFGNEYQEVERCSAYPSSDNNYPTPPLLDGSSIFHDAELNKLTLAPVTPVAAQTTCNISTFQLKS